jgi:hypothetical protein
MGIKLAEKQSRRLPVPDPAPPALAGLGICLLAASKRSEDGFRRQRK